MIVDQGNIRSSSGGNMFFSKKDFPAKVILFENSFSMFVAFSIVNDVVVSFIISIFRKSIMYRREFEHKSKVFQISLEHPFK